MVLNYMYGRQGAWSCLSMQTVVVNCGRVGALNANQPMPSLCGRCTSGLHTKSVTASAASGILCTNPTQEFGGGGHGAMTRTPVRACHAQAARHNASVICVIENQAHDGWRDVHQACTTAYLYHPPAMLCVSALVSCGRLQNSKALVMLCVSCLVSLEYPAL